MDTKGTDTVLDVVGKVVDFREVEQYSVDRGCIPLNLIQPISRNASLQVCKYTHICK